MVDNFHGRHCPPLSSSGSTARFLLSFYQKSRLVLWIKLTSSFESMILNRKKECYRRQYFQKEPLEPFKSRVNRQILDSYVPSSVETSLNIMWNFYLFITKLIYTYNNGSECFQSNNRILRNPSLLLKPFWETSTVKRKEKVQKLTELDLEVLSLYKAF